MASLIKSLIQATIGGRSKVYRVLFLGLDSSGRTTTLYRWKLGEVLATVPTIGFNVEEIPFRDEYPTNSSLIVWDVGGCDKIRPLWRHYFHNTACAVFFVDSNDNGRFEQARDEIHYLAREEELRCIPFCIAVNKQDLPNCASPEELTEKLDLHHLSQPWQVQACSSKTGEGLDELMDAICNLVTENKNTSEKSDDITHRGKAGGEENARDELMAKKLEHTLLDWLERKDEADDVFLQKLDDCTLESWDHRTHLRIAWLLLQRHGRREGMRQIFERIRKFIENSPRTHRSRGTTFHETMTYFWVHMVHYALVTTAITRESKKDDENFGKEEFRVFLLLNPQLANGGLFLHYYSKKLMLQTAESRMEVMLPDLKPLPSLVTDVKEGNDNQPQTVLPRAAPLSDEEFFQQWKNGTLPSWGHELRLRAIWLCLHRYGRAKGVKEAFARLEASEGKRAHHVTKVYFWIQMLDYHIKKLLKTTITSNLPTFGMFIQQPTAQPLRNPDLIHKYYTEAALERGKSAFQIADRKKIPSVI